MPSFLYLCVAGLVLYFSWKLLKLLHFYVGEYYVLWNVATGGRSDKRALSAKMRQHVYVCKTELLDEVSVNELYTFLVKMIDTDVTIKDFHFSVLLTYTFAVICRDRKDGSLRGVTLMGVDHKELNGVKFTLIRFGLGFFQNYYRGGPFLYYVFAYHVMKELVMHPLTPVYVIGKAFSYKSYLALCNTLPHSYPRYDLETTEFAKNLLNSYGAGTKLLSETYDDETFVLKREKTVMKEGVAVLHEDDLKNPHIKFFVERNPGWVKGHQMMVTGEVRWPDLFWLVWRSISRAVRARRGPHKVSMLKRSQSFQCEAASRYATTFSEMDIGGGRNDCVIEDDNCEEAGVKLQRSSSMLHSYDVYNDL